MPSNSSVQPFKLEYEESYVEQDEDLTIWAQSTDHVKILDVTKVGTQLRYQFVVMWHADAYSEYLERLKSGQLRQEDGDGAESSG